MSSAKPLRPCPKAFGTWAVPEPCIAVPVVAMAVPEFGTAVSVLTGIVEVLCGGFGLFIKIGSCLMNAKVTHFY